MTDIELLPGEYLTPHTREEMELWYGTNLQRIADEDSRYGATLLRVGGRLLPCLCRREPEGEGWYRIVAPGSWSPIFAGADGETIKSERRPDGVIEFWCHRQVMSPLRAWIKQGGGDGS
jgi:hypothetical protein